MTPEEILTWVVWLEPDMLRKAGQLATFKRLVGFWVAKLNPVLVNDQGRAELMDWLAAIWNSQNAGEAKGTGEMRNPAAFLNGCVTSWQESKQ